MPAPENPNTLITSFQESTQKVKQLNEQTTEEIGRILQEKRAHQFRMHVKRVAGRKVKWAIAVGFGFSLVSLVHFSTMQRYRGMREQSVQSYESQLIPFFQVFEDRSFLIKDNRRNDLIDFTFKDPHERKAFDELYQPFKLSSDFIPLQDRYAISNLSVPYHSQPAMRRYVSNISREMANMRI